MLVVQGLTCQSVHRFLFLSSDSGHGKVGGIRSILLWKSSKPFCALDREEPTQISSPSLVISPCTFCCLVIQPSTQETFLSSLEMLTLPGRFLFSQQWLKILLHFSCCSPPTTIQRAFTFERFHCSLRRTVRATKNKKSGRLRDSRMPQWLVNFFPQHQG